jgi:hypothetical protein
LLLCRPLRRLTLRYDFCGSRFISYRLLRAYPLRSQSLRFALGLLGMLIIILSSQLNFPSPLQVGHWTLLCICRQNSITTYGASAFPLSHSLTAAWDLPNRLPNWANEVPTLEEKLLDKPGYRYIMRAHICSTQITEAHSWAIDHHSNPRRNTMIVEAQVTINGSIQGGDLGRNHQHRECLGNHQRNRKH